MAVRTAPYKGNRKVVNEQIWQEPVQTNAPVPD
jgi:hypothetical protein